MTCRHAAAAAALSMTFGLTHAQTRTFDSSSGRGASAGLAQGGLDYPIKPVPFTRVHLNDIFWAPLFASNWRCNRGSRRACRNGKSSERARRRSTRSDRRFADPLRPRSAHAKAEDRACSIVLPRFRDRRGEAGLVR